MPPNSRIVLFGPQLTQLQWTTERLCRLQSDLQNISRLAFLRRCLAQLPAFIASLPLSQNDVLSQLETLAGLAGNETPDLTTLTSNVQLAPLTVVSHIVEWMSITSSDMVAQGFCVGFLSAAVAATTTQQDFEHYAANAIRIATCIGLIIDAEDASHASADRVTAVSVRCQSHSDRAVLESTLDLLPGAYISCITDDRTLTVTLPRRHLGHLTDRLGENRIPMTIIGLDGSYHHPKHTHAAQQLKEICAQVPDLQLPIANDLHLPLRSTSDTELIVTGPLHDVAIDLILCKRAHWYQTIKRMVDDNRPQDPHFIAVGSESCIPRSLAVAKSNPGLLEEIAVVGMACRFPQAESLEEFWRLISTGKTAIGTLPPSRFDPADLQRKPKLPAFWGNFLSNPDVFDHRFFGISGREAKSMDPQQRLALQVAYEAVEMAGYYGIGSKSRRQETNVGCYLGVGSVDYEGNVGSADATAFSATGTLRAFISGRISHFFGWGGPSITFDTACSSSAVAIHTACKALLAGECDMALAGGVNVITSPSLHQNLAAASFLNPSGSSCAFDASAAGYCRGEGAGIVVLKPLSKAIAAGDNILSVISGSAVNQGSSCSSITVPDSHQQSALYSQALSLGRIDPTDVSYVEAHGTGTQVGDPIEYDSVRLALTGAGRKSNVFLGSVKDNIGHAEAASGAAGLIKTILMMHHKTIPRQANFVNLNPKIKRSEQIEVPQQAQPWTSPHIVALVNNYGAAGSNAAIVLRAYTAPGKQQQAVDGLLMAYPIVVAANSALSLKMYLEKLKNFVLKSPSISLRDVAYSLLRQQNPNFEYRASFVARDTSDFKRYIENQDSGITRAVNQPVVLAFWGQTGRTVTVSRELYDSCALLRYHLDKCEAVCQYLGLPGILNNIFVGEPVDDIVLLHCMLLAIQVSCALSWLDAGLKVDTLVGHSFGQLAALCVAESISLKDAFQLVAGRARLIRDKWGPDRGVMLMIECDVVELNRILTQVNSSPGHRVEVACYNGPRSFVLAGDASSVDHLQQECSSFKTVPLRNTHAYHSHMADGILNDLRVIAASITIRPPRIHVETCSPDASWTTFTADELVQHTRQPVYFQDAVERIAVRLPSAVWLEAGSATPIIGLVRRILSPSRAPHVFIPMELGTSDAREALASVVCQLWKFGAAAEFWPFHEDKSSLPCINLPPYQFEQTRHWIDYKPSLCSPQPSQLQSSLVSLIHPAGADGTCLFSVDTSNPIFDLATRGHAVVGQSLCPASMYIELAIQSAVLLSKGLDTTQSSPHIEGLTISSPLGLEADLYLRLTVVRPGSWDFRIFSKSLDQKEHGTGRVTMSGPNDMAAGLRLKLLQKIAPPSSLTRILDCPDRTTVGGSIVYQLFQDVVHYAPYYRGVKSVSAMGNEAVGFIDVPQEFPTFLDEATICHPIDLDNFLQVAGIHVNCLSLRRDDEVFMCTAVDEVILGPCFPGPKADRREWTAYTHYEAVDGGGLTNNIFVYDAQLSLVAVIVGAAFRSVPLKSLARALTRLNQPVSDGIDHGEDDIKPQPDSAYQSPSLAEQMPVHPAVQKKTSTVERFQTASTTTTLQKLRGLLASIIEIPLDDVQPSSTIQVLGIDSLLVSEVLWEIQKLFDMRISQAQFQQCADVLSLSQLIQPSSLPSPVILTNDLPKPPPTLTPDEATPVELDINLAVLSQKCFSEVKPYYDSHAGATGFAGFYQQVFPDQSQLVVRYILDAFASLGCDLEAMAVGCDVSIIPHIESQRKVVPQLYRILEDARLIDRAKDGRMQRSETPVPTKPAASLHAVLLDRFPKHASETKLLCTTGSQLADCLSGASDPISLIFRDASTRGLLEDVYTNAPMFKTGTLLLAQYLASVVSRLEDGQEIRILELGAGTGGTTKGLVSALAPFGSFTYTFTDISSSLVAAARRKFTQPFMRFAVLDIEKAPASEMLGAYDIVLSTNCIHATRDLVQSTTHIRQMLQPDGVLCLVELTRNLFWFDLVFGLLEGWWLFNDGREHALADESRWKRCLRDAGFTWVDWSDSPSGESDLVRVITASPSKTMGKETVVFKQIDGLDLEADIHYPVRVADLNMPLPVALMIHGGGHIMLSRNDIRPRQTQLLQEKGFLPIAVDYRLCPEVTLAQGPMEDVVDALAWIRTVLPTIQLQRADVKIDGRRVVSVGWSTGGHLAVSLGWNSIPRHIEPPQAILAFYCPLDYEDEFWLRPNVPVGSESTTTSYELDQTAWSAVREKPIASYNVAPAERAIGGWLSSTDPRSRLALYMNWHGRSLHVLLNGLYPTQREEPNAPTEEAIRAVSPLAQIRSGAHSTPTFIIHPRDDDLIPWQQAQRTYEALQRRGIDSQLCIVEDAPHLFDIYRQYQERVDIQDVIQEGYEFLRARV
ncbi:hypothetical protein N7471_008619 [Penicillium samsonianum]|uniref:uncharacterized protein n=1 Tax=Penicillium samsonianum TaxID=1882272 RepID=UPI002546CFAC|nr:uncharacterized protein N7471_008619 [Penicillium samsonianum]KAJ6133404.1 hypothetical protein N7471_008619 [Penicillium samsonianum]